MGPFTSLGRRLPFTPQHLPPWPFLPVLSHSLQVFSVPATSSSPFLQAPSITHFPYSEESNLGKLPLFLSKMSGTHLACCLLPGNCPRPTARCGSVRGFCKWVPMGFAPTEGFRWSQLELRLAALLLQSLRKLAWKRIRPNWCFLLTILSATGQLIYNFYYVRIR